MKQLIEKILNCIQNNEDTNKQEQEKIKRQQYQDLINARNVNYDSFNKWATYFSTIIGAIFVGYYSIKTSSNSKNFNLEIILLSFLGYVVSFLWFLSCKGFHHWNKLHIDRLKKYQNSIYGDYPYDTDECFLVPYKGINISTPRISIWLSFIITIVWGTILIDNVNDYCDENKLYIPLISTIITLCPFIKIIISTIIILCPFIKIIISTIITYILNIVFYFIFKGGKNDNNLPTQNGE